MHIGADGDQGLDLWSMYIAMCVLKPGASLPGHVVRLHHLYITKASLLQINFFLQRETETKAKGITETFPDTVGPRLKTKS